jgi:hypothetical protein
MNHSRRRLQKFIRANGVCVQKHSLIVWRKYIDAKEMMFSGGAYSQANKIKEEELEKLTFVGTKWGSINDADKLALQFDDLWIVAKQTYAMWVDAHSKLKAATKNTAAKIFTGDYRGAMNGTLGVTFEVVNRYVTGMPFARDYIAVASQAISVVTYLYWRYTTAERVKQLQAAVISALSVKQLLGANVTDPKIKSYTRAASRRAGRQVKWVLEEDWEADPIPDTPENTVAVEFDASNIRERRPNEDFKILMDTVRCSRKDKDDEDEE